MSLQYVSEQTIGTFVTQKQVSEAIEAMFGAIARGETRSFPTVREHLDHAGAVFGFKSGFEPGRGLLGIKAGGLWPSNWKRNLANHQSTVLLFDPDSGEPRALVRANLLTALRTAAASAISIRHLARRDATILGIVGAGGQARYQIRAALIERPFDTVLVADIEERRAVDLVSQLADLEADIHVSPVRDLAGMSDVIITVTPAVAPTVMCDWIRPGTHIACMGADTKGKQEIETSLVAESRLFADDRDQSVSIGEFQHAYAEGVIEPDDLVFIGDVITGAAQGRTDDRQITIFDSSGIGLQDLVAARLALSIASDRGAIATLD